MSWSVFLLVNAQREERAADSSARGTGAACEVWCHQYPDVVCVLRNQRANEGQRARWHMVLCVDGFPSRAMATGFLAIWGVKVRQIDRHVLRGVTLYNHAHQSIPTLTLRVVPLHQPDMLAHSMQQYPFTNAPTSITPSPDFEWSRGYDLVSQATWRQEDGEVHVCTQDVLYERLHPHFLELLVPQPPVQLLILNVELEEGGEREEGEVEGGEVEGEKEGEGKAEIKRKMSAVAVW